MRKEDQNRVLAEVRRRVVERQHQSTDSLEEAVESSLDAERDRLSREPLSVRSLVDRAFWFGIGLRLRLGGEDATDDALFAVVSHYAEEICGDFDPVAYEVALRLLPPALRVLLSSSALTNVPDKLLGDEHDRIVLEGQTDAIQDLHKRFTLIFAPSHHSNLDSIVLGLGLNRLGVPPLIYGAGINLLGNPIMSLFMHNFGAYTVDRQKVDPIYRDTLKEYVVVTLENGYHHLFYPGGTRSRTGALEQKLKLGLLGASADAERNLRQANSARRVLIVPVTLSYELVPEADSLVGNASESRARFAEFAQRLLALDSQIHLVFGHPLDVQGHRVDARGRSLTADGQHTDPATDLRVLESDPRAATRKLGEAIAAAYREDNLIQATHVASFALRSLLHEGSTAVSRDQLEEVLETLLARLNGLQQHGRLSVSTSLTDAHTTLLAADTAFSNWHGKRALAVEAATVHTEDADLLGFYANRLVGYGLQG